MNIIKTYPANLNAMQTYKLTLAPGAHKMTELEGSTEDLVAWAMYEDSQPKIDDKTGAVCTDDNGEVVMESKTVLSIMTPEGEVYGTISGTFIRDFQAMVECFALYEETVTSIKVISGESKKGRKFITCTAPD